MTWQTRQKATQLTAVGNSFEYFDVTPQLNPGELAVLEITIDNEDASSATDDAEIVIEEALDQGTPNWSEVRRRSYTVDPGGIAAVTFHDRVSGKYKFRVGVRSAGSTDTYTADLSVLTDGVSA